MAHISNRVVDFLEVGFAQTSAAAVGRAFFRALEPYGCRAINARAYRSPSDLRTHGHIYTRIAPSSCTHVYADRRFDAHNPLPRMLRRTVEPIHWSAIKPRDPGEQWVVETLRDLGFPDGLAIPSHGPDNYFGITSLAFERLHQVSPEDRRAIELAALTLHQRMLSLADQSRPGLPSDRLPPLTTRERDVLAYVAEGRSNNQIADALGLSAATIATHITNLRHKLGARTRSQAVAIYLSGIDASGG